MIIEDRTSTVLGVNLILYVLILCIKSGAFVTYENNTFLIETGVSVLHWLYDNT